MPARSGPAGLVVKVQSCTKDLFRVVAGPRTVALILHGPTQRSGSSERVGDSKAVAAQSHQVHIVISVIHPYFPVPPMPICISKLICSTTGV
jgi:hypothetical protein